MSKYNLTNIAEGMGYKEFEDAKEEERLDKHPDKEMIKKVKAMMAKEKSVKEGEAVDLAIEASQEKAGIKETNSEEMEEVMGVDRQGNKQPDTDGSDATKYKKAAMKEEEGFVEVNQDEIKMHLDQYRDGNIDGDDLANAVEEIVFSRMDEAEAIPTSPGKMKKGDDGKMYNVIASNAERKMAMRSVIDILRDELGVKTDDAFDYIKTHREDLFNGNVDAFNKDEVLDDYKEYESVNFETGSDYQQEGKEMDDLKEHFSRFLKDYQ